MSLPRFEVTADSMKVFFYLKILLHEFELYGNILERL